MNSHQVDRAKWQKMTIFEQMGNIGAEVGRALTAKQRGDEQSLKGALYRGLDLFDASAQIWSTQSLARTREILRAREQFVEAATTKVHDNKLENYFMQFAIAARLNR